MKKDLGAFDMEERCGHAFVLRAGNVTGARRYATFRFRRIVHSSFRANCHPTPLHREHCALRSTPIP
jgi:hypothetical protein